MKYLLSFGFLLSGCGYGSSTEIEKLPHSARVSKVEEKTCPQIATQPVSEPEPQVVKEPEYKEVVVGGVSFESEIDETPVDKAQLKDVVSVEEPKIVLEFENFREVNGATFTCISQDLKKVHTFEPACGTLKYKENGRIYPGLTLLRNELRVCKIRAGKTDVYCQFFGIPVCPEGYKAICG